MRRRGWAPIVLAVAVSVAPGAAGPQSIWDDPAFQLLRQSMDALSAKEFARAGELSAQAIAQLPHHPLAYYVRGQAAAAQNRWDDAAAAFGKVVELYPQSFAGRRDLAASLEHLGKVKEATDAYEAALALRDQDDLRVRMALMLAENGEGPRARAELAKLAARGSTVPVVWSTLGRLAYEASDWAGAEKAYTRSAALKDDGRTWFNLGVVRLRLQDLQGALQAFEQAARDPNVKKQAETEAGRVREAMSRSTGPSRQVQTPGQTSVPGPSGR